MSYLTAVRHLKYFHFWAVCRSELGLVGTPQSLGFSLAVIERRSVVTVEYTDR